MIEHVQKDALGILKYLKSMGYAITWQRVDDLIDLSEALKKPWDIVLAESNLPKMTGCDALQLVKTHAPLTPIIFVVQTANEEWAAEAICLGADDYLLKEHVSQLPSIIERTRYSFRVKDLDTQLPSSSNPFHYWRHMSRYDNLTGLATRFTLLEQLKTLIENQATSDEILVVLYIQLDGFKAIHQNLGYEAALTFLQEVAARLQPFINERSFAARTTIDHFALAYPTHDQDLLPSWIHSLSHALLTPYVLGAKTMHCPAYIGVATYPGGAFDSNDVLRKAEIAAGYVSAQSCTTHHPDKKGNNIFVFYESRMSALLEDNLNLQRNLIKSLENREIHVFFQPQICLQSQKILGYEAQVFWKHEQTEIPQSQLFQLAEETGFIFFLGEWILNHIFQQMKHWQFNGSPLPSMTLSLSARQLQEDNIVDVFQKALSESDIPVNTISKKIHETAIIRNSEKAHIVLSGLHALGLRVLLAGFENAYLNFAHLKHFPIHYLEIGPNMTSVSDSSNLNRKTLINIIKKAKSTGMKTLAVEIHTLEQKKTLQDLGCDIAQGEVAGKTLDSHQIREALRFHSEPCISSFR